MDGSATINNSWMGQRRHNSVSQKRRRKGHGRTTTIREFTFNNIQLTTVADQPDNIGTNTTTSSSSLPPCISKDYDVETSDPHSDSNDNKFNDTDKIHVDQDPEDSLMKTKKEAEDCYYYEEEHTTTTTTTTTTTIPFDDDKNETILESDSKHDYNNISATAKIHPQENEEEETRSSSIPKSYEIKQTRKKRKMVDISLENNINTMNMTNNITHDKNQSLSNSTSSTSSSSARGGTRKHINLIMDFTPNGKSKLNVFNYASIGIEKFGKSEAILHKKKKQKRYAVMITDFIDEIQSQLKVYSQLYTHRGDLNKKYNKLQRARINGRLEMLEADKRKTKVETEVLKAKQEIETLEKNIDEEASIGLFLNSFESVLNNVRGSSESQTGHTFGVIGNLHLASEQTLQVEYLNNLNAKLQELL